MLSRADEGPGAGGYRIRRVLGDGGLVPTAPGAGHRPRGERAGSGHSEASSAGDTGIGERGAVEGTDGDAAGRSGGVTAIGGLWDAAPEGWLRRMARSWIGALKTTSEHWRGWPPGPQVWVKAVMAAEATGVIPPTGRMARTLTPVLGAALGDGCGPALQGRALLNTVRRRTRVCSAMGFGGCKWPTGLEEANPGGPRRRGRPCASGIGPGCRVDTFWAAAGTEAPASGARVRAQSPPGLAGPDQPLRS